MKVKMAVECHIFQLLCGHLGLLYFMTHFPSLTRPWDLSEKLKRADLLVYPNQGEVAVDLEEGWPGYPNRCSSLNQPI
jgi:hypothetical protein